MIHPDHKAVEIAVYKKSVKWLEKRFCSVHKDRELTVGCPGCYQTFCMKCLAKSKQCKAGKKNEILAIIGFINGKKTEERLVFQGCYVFNTVCHISES